MQLASEYVSRRTYSVAFVQVDRIYLRCRSVMLRMWCPADTNDTPSARGAPFPLSPRYQGYEMLQKLDPPMSDWFCSVPHAIDTISYSMKACESIFLCCFMADVFQFQQDMLTSLIRFLRKKTAQQRDVLHRVKHESEELRRYARFVHRVDHN